MAEVRDQKVQGVSVDHPRIRDFIKGAAKQGRSREEIAKLSGQPLEVVDRHIRDARKPTQDEVESQRRDPK